MTSTMKETPFNGQCIAKQKLCTEGAGALFCHKIKRNNLWTAPTQNLCQISIAYICKMIILVYKSRITSNVGRTTLVITGYSQNIIYVLKCLYTVSNQLICQIALVCHFFLQWCLLTSYLKRFIDITNVLGTSIKL